MTGIAFKVPELGLDRSSLPQAIKEFGEVSDKPLPFEEFVLTFEARVLPMLNPAI